MQTIALPSRRRILSLAGTGAFGLTFSRSPVFAQRTSSKPLLGIFPIAQTPFTQDDKLDLDCLVEELRFIDRGGVHGFVWPQMVSEWLSLTENERLSGMEALGAAGRSLRPAVIFGVQSADLAASIRYARHAEKIGADGIISLPPSENLTSAQIFDYYKAIGSSTRLPLFVQAVGEMDVDLIMKMYKEVPTMRYLKDEAGDVLARIVQLTSLSSGEIKVMTGSHGRTLIEEMRRGSAGCMPLPGFADLYASTWDLWRQGKYNEAFDAHARTLLLLTEMGVYSGTEPMKYILYLRGVFKNYAARKVSGQGFSAAAKAAAAGTGPARNLDEAGKRALKQVVDYLKPHFRA